ncbi:Sugar phosphate isomerase/epimerase [Cyclobacterium xiamenense]|uniref:Sugar phosphate isomerase/epimerase n=1 Tax=Cyclobacterium xiamenense TaxID=1297121 RepID=A0A1H7BL35_9BACT|nr:sugar phosphate isomerase/epimerase [Cyclobacterium xiamenense]SEJ77067.1 Sugar phosphate isomerase/epimerase [Cyclobacterium xiamenense]
MEVTQHRRSFIKKLGMLGLATATGAHWLQAAPAQKQIGLQLYSLRADIDGNVSGILQQVAAIGFTHLEAANYSEGTIYGYAPEEIRKMIADLGMSMQSAHVGGPRDFSGAKHGEALDWWKAAAAAHAAVGASFLIKPSMPKPDSLQELEKWCNYYNEIGAIANANDLQFGFHNHSREFDEIEGQVMYDFMLENTDPDLFCMELDVYWATKAGKDPVAYLKKYAGRFPLLHIKDEEEIGQSGTMNFGPIFDAAYAQGMKGYYVEVERYNHAPIKSVEMSYDYLNEAAYVR